MFSVPSWFLYQPMNSVYKIVIFPFRWFNIPSTRWFRDCPGLSHSYHLSSILNMSELGCACVEVNFLIFAEWSQKVAAKKKSWNRCTSRANYNQNESENVVQCSLWMACVEHPSHPSRKVRVWLQWIIFFDKLLFSVLFSPPESFPTCTFGLCDVYWMELGHILTIFYGGYLESKY